MSGLPFLAPAARHMPVSTFGLVADLPGNADAHTFNDVTTERDDYLS